MEKLFIFAFICDDETDEVDVKLNKPNPTQFHLTQRNQRMYQHTKMSKLAKNEVYCRRNYHFIIISSNRFSSVAPSMLPTKIFPLRIVQLDSSDISPHIVRIYLCLNCTDGLQ